MGRGISVHIGVNQLDPDHYEGWEGPLQACETDARSYASIADSRGFESKLLLTADATRDAVVAAVTAAAGELAPGDTFLLTYAGHGGHVPDTSGDEEDAFDETWCLHDGQLLDDELHTLWSRFRPGARVLMVSDSCHSGTASRSPQLADLGTLASGPTAEELGVAGAAVRGMPTQEAMRTFSAHREFYQTVQESVRVETDPPVTVRLLSGCQDNQMSLDGDPNGLFTGRLLHVWDQGAFTGTYTQFHRRILRNMPATQTPNHYVIGPPDPQFDKEVPFTP